jgi:hypothetical protein
MLFAGSAVASGAGFGVVTATGMATEIGKIQSDIQVGGGGRRGEVGGRDGEVDVSGVRACCRRRGWRALCAQRGTIDWLRPRAHAPRAPALRVPPSTCQAASEQEVDTPLKQKLDEFGGQLANVRARGPAGGLQRPAAGGGRPSLRAHATLAQAQNPTHNPPLTPPPPTPPHPTARSSLSSASSFGPSTTTTSSPSCGAPVASCPTGPPAASRSPSAPTTSRSRCAAIWTRGVDRFDLGAVMISLQRLCSRLRRPSSVCPPAPDLPPSASLSPLQGRPGRRGHSGGPPRGHYHLPCAGHAQDGQEERDCQVGCCLTWV